MLRKLFLVLAGLGLCAAAWAFINPSFSPVHLVQQSEAVLVLKFEAATKDGKVTATVVKALKGEKPAQPLVLDFGATAFKEQGEEVARMIDAGAKDALFFIGQFEEGGGGGGAQGPKAMLHVGGKWVVFNGAEGGSWDMEKIDAHMLGTWAGSTDMLQRAVDYVLADPDADVPVRANCEWDTPVKFATLDGKVSFAKAVDLDGTGKLYLFVGSDKGDKLFAWKDGKFADVTAERKLESKSQLAAWVDVNGDGKLDLVSSEPPLAVWTQQADGTFKRTYSEPMRALVPSPLSLAAGVSAEGACIIESKPGWPSILPFGKDGQPLPVPAMEISQLGQKDWGQAGVCLLADFDGDGIPDRLQLYEHGALFFKGTKPGESAAPVATQIGLGKGKSSAQIGDYDADGLLDIYTTAEDGNHLWHNLGGAKFVDMLSVSGEIAYISKPGGVDGIVCDINNDGRQDIFIAYAEMPPQIFFDRGFRSFGHAHEIDLGEQKLVEESAKGQQAGTVADFTGDGAQDMVIILKDGEAWILPRKAQGGKALSVSVAITPGKGTPEPLLVTGWSGKRCLGAWNVTSGGAPAFFGLTDAGTVSLKWKLPDGSEKSAKVNVIDRPVRFVIGQ